MRNILLSKYPFVLSSDQLAYNVSSEMPDFTVNRALDVTHPRRTWRTTSVQVTADVTIYCAGTKVGLYVKNTNYTSCNIYRSSDGVTFEPCGPNILKSSHEFNATSSWAFFSGATVYGYSTGPDLETNGSNIRFPSGGAIHQYVAMNRDVRNTQVLITAWVKAASSSAIFRFGVACGPYGVTWSDEYTLNSNWTKITVPLTTNAATPDTNIRFVMWNFQATTQEVCIFGLQMTPRTTQEPIALYKTDDKGLVIGQNEKTGNRQHYFSLPNVDDIFVKYSIPVQDTLDDTITYATGSLTFVDSIETVWGGHSYPIGVEVIRPHSRTDFLGQNYEFLSLGDNRVRISISGMWHARMHKTMFDYAKEIGKPVLLVMNTRRPDLDESLGDMSDAYICYLMNDMQYQYTIPELFEAQFVFDEIS